MTRTIQTKAGIASRMVCDSIADYLNSADKIEDLTEVEIAEAIGHAQVLLQESGKENPKYNLMSTTLTLAYFNQDTVIVAWWGDSRIYHIRNGVVIWKSKDHSLVQQLIDDGIVTEEEALEHPKKNVLHSCLCAREQLGDFDSAILVDVCAGDYILLCTDGILENIDEEVLKTILDKNQKEDDKQKLFHDYCKDWTMDNYSMYLLQVD